MGKRNTNCMYGLVFMFADTPEGTMQYQFSTICSGFSLADADTRAQEILDSFGITERELANMALAK